MVTHYSSLTLYRRLMSYVRPYWPHIVGIFLIDLLSTPLALLKPLGLKIAVDCVVGSKPLPGPLAAVMPDSIAHSVPRLLFVAVVLQILVVLLIQLQELAHHVLSTYTGEALTLKFREHLFRHLQRLSIAFHDSRGLADSVYRIQHDAPSIQMIMVQGLMPFLSAAVMLATMFYVMARLNWQLALVALAIAPFLAILIGSYDRLTEGKYGQVNKIESSAMKVVQETLGAIRVVKAFGREDRENARFVRYSNTGIRAHLRVAYAEGLLGLVMNLTTAVGTALVLYIGIRGVLAGSLTLGDLLMVMAYLLELYGPLETISAQIATLEGSMAGVRRVVQVLDEPSEVLERLHALSLHRARGTVEFRDVSFSYEESHPILRNLSVVIRAGTRVGIAGKTGAGKTTLVTLLNRFYDPTSGEILLDGVDLRDYKLADLRRQFALVLQEPVLFSTTIAENIAYGRLGARDAEIVEAAKAANAHDFIMRLPKGYQTRVGERGMRVSGGERQRISLARAFLKNAPILILDEPTSSVDVKTEAVIMDAMERLMHGRTTFFISHRLNTLNSCDIVLSLEGGRLAHVPADLAAAARSAPGVLPAEAPTGPRL
jgi:ATP-binding cassette subfamily B protein